MRLRQGQVADTIELEGMIYLDVDGAGQALGLEFVDADDFVPFVAGPVVP